VSLATREDARLVADIEKLIKTKIEIEPLEIEDDRPRRAPRREFHDDEAAPRVMGSASHSTPSATSRPQRSHAHGDPFFDRPYEPDPNASPSWEGSMPAAATPAASTIPRNGKAKRRVASLLGG
jgi:hypothetical protein